MIDQTKYSVNKILFKKGQLIFSFNCLGKCAYLGESSVFWQFTTMKQLNFKKHINLQEISAVVILISYQSIQTKSVLVTQLCPS